MTLRAYAALGVLAIIVGLAGLVLWYRADLATANANLMTAKASLNTAVALNAEKDTAIRLLGDRAAITDASLTAIRQEVAAINQTTTETNQAITDLGNTDAGTKSFLLTKLPPELERLLNKTP